MSLIQATVAWQNGQQVFTDNRYSRAHRWSFDGGLEIPASSSPDVVPVPLSDAAAIDPEEAFVAAISSCHMLWFLSFAARRNFVVASYTDRASGELGKNNCGKMAIRTVTLHPEVKFSGTSQPTPEQLDELHEQARDACFIANSVTTSVLCEPVKP